MTASNAPATPPGGGSWVFDESTGQLERAAPPPPADPQPAPPPAMKAAAPKQEKKHV